MPVVVVFEFGRAKAHVTLAGQLDGPAFEVQVVVCPVQVRLGGHVEAVCTPPGSTHVQVGCAEQGKGPTLPVQVVVWPVPGVWEVSVVQLGRGLGVNRSLVRAKRILLTGYRGRTASDGCDGCHGDSGVSIGGC